MREGEVEIDSMVLGQIEARGVRDGRVLSAMRAVPRQLFVPAELRAYAYEDCPLPIGFGQTISQPYIVAFTLEALGLRGEEKVLELGAGSGYQTALLSILSKEVWSLERIPGLMRLAEANLEKAGRAGNIYLALGDGYLGLAEEAPFGAIAMSAAPAEIPAALLDQLSTNGGILVGPEGDAGRQKLVRITRDGARFKREELMDVAFVPLVRGVAR